MPSKQISIRRRRVAIGGIDDNIVAEAVTKIGSAFKFGKPLRGLEGEEEKKLLPLVTSVDTEDRNFREKADNYWRELSIAVTEHGTTLEVGTDENGDPINPKDYVAYRFALKHPQVAPDKDSMMRRTSLRFYIYDPAEHAAQAYAKVEKKTEAYVLFGQLQASDNGLLALAQVLRMSGINPDNMPKEAVVNSVANIIEATPDKFLALAGNRNLRDQALLEEMVDKEVVRKLGTIYMFGDTRIGDTLDEAVAYIQSEKNSRNLLTMLAQLQNKRKEKGLPTDDLDERLNPNSKRKSKKAEEPELEEAEA